jgi:hypothetical protein
MRKLATDTRNLQDHNGEGANATMKDPARETEYTVKASSYHVLNAFSRPKAYSQNVSRNWLCA